MANQAEIRARTGPGMFSTGVGIDQANLTVLMVAMVVAAQAILVLDRPCNVLRCHGELALRPQDRPMAEEARPRMARGAGL